MNIEELELSLRTEFEGQVRNVLAGIKQDVADFQSKFQAELDEHRTRLDQAISGLSGSFPESTAFDAAFNESVSEHLRLARDDGAQVAATAFGEAEKLRFEAAPAPVVGFDLIRDAINDISSKNSQATILQSLVGHASRFASRGVFFILKNDHFVAWKVFGSEASEEGIRDVVFPASSDTVLAASVRSSSKVSAAGGSYSEDSLFLETLQFDRPAEMHSIPLMARGRAVAVLYADAGEAGAVNADALETLVRVSGLTVELLAASQQAAPAFQPPAAAHAEPVHETREAETASYLEEVDDRIEQPVHEDQPEAGAVDDTTPVFESPSEAASDVTVEYAEPEIEQPSEAVSFESGEMPVEEYIGEVTYEVEQNGAAPVEVPTVEAPEVETFQPVTEELNDVEAVSEFAFNSNESYDASYSSDDGAAEAEADAAEAVPVTIPEVHVPVAAAPNGHSEVAVVAEPVIEVTVPEAKKSRFSERNVDLPIEVSDEERRPHNDARRFARLLVSEIKLYNEQKVAEGREAGDLYERLKEAIDRSREMYDKRVQPAVASKFDYFHYEVVNSLADGQDSRLGNGYPGASV